MISDALALDTNILIYADNPESTYHRPAKEILESIFKGQMSGCLTQQILAEYFAVVTNGRRITNPLSPKEAEIRVLFFERSRRLRKIYPKRSTIKHAIQICAKNNFAGAQVYDIIYGVTLLENGIKRLVTENVKDFAVFNNEGLTVLSLEQTFRLLHARTST